MMEKSIFNFKIQYKDGSITDLYEDKNLWVSSFRIFSTTPDHDTDTVQGRHGSIYLGTTLKERKITTKISIEAVDYIDFDLFRDEIFRIFNPLEKFYIIRDLQPGKRMEVSVASDFDFDIDYVTLEDGEFQLDFVIHSVFLESVGTTQDTFDMESGLWQLSQGLIDSDEMIYTHNTPSFSIYNAGDIAVDPKQFPLLITFQGASDGLTIKNTTTGDTWQYNDITAAGDIITLDGVRALKNDLSCFSQTNFEVLTIAKGWNDFEITGASGPFSISFEFRFYYF